VITTTSEPLAQEKSIPVSTTVKADSRKSKKKSSKSEKPEPRYLSRDTLLTVEDGKGKGEKVSSGGFLWARRSKRSDTTKSSKKDRSSLICGSNFGSTTSKSKWRATAKSKKQNKGNSAVVDTATLVGGATAITSMAREVPGAPSTVIRETGMEHCEASVDVGESTGGNKASDIPPTTGATIGSSEKREGPQTSNGGATNSVQKLDNGITFDTEATPVSSSMPAPSSRESKFQSTETIPMIKPIDHIYGIAQGDVVLSLLPETANSKQAEATAFVQVKDAIWRIRSLRQRLAQRDRASVDSFNRSPLKKSPARCSHTGDVGEAGSVQETRKLEAEALEHLKVRSCCVMAYFWR
jgi:hypothetical protein